MRTRLEFIIRSKRIKPGELARRAAYSRQHLARMRDGLPSLARSEDAVLEALREMTGSRLEREAVFEPKSARLADVFGGAEVRRGRKNTKKRTAANAATPGIRFAAMDDRAFEITVERIWSASASEALVRDLLDAGEVLLDREPQRANVVYELAWTFVGKLESTPSLLLHALRGAAEKGHSNALRMLGRFTDAVATLKRAERDFEAATYCTRELGYTRYCLGTVRFKMERWSDAEKAVAAARELLDSEHDRGGVVNCDIVQGCVYLERGDLDRAREIFLAQRKIVERRHDEETLARVWMNLAVCELRRRDIPPATHWLDRATRKFREMGLTSEVARARWCRGRLLILEGKANQGLREYRAAAREFERLGAQADAGFVELDMVGEFVERSEWRAAEALSRALAVRFLTAGIARSGALALDYLRQAVQHRIADRGAIDRVRRHLRRIEVFPEEAFKTEDNVEPA